MNRAQRFGRAQWLILIAAFVCVAITAALGAWQLRRAAVKEQLADVIFKQNEQVAGTHTALNAIDLRAFEPSDWLHRRVLLKGRWLHEHTVFLDNRPMLVAASQRVGFYLATPLVLDGSNRVMWVQRGWIARDFQDRNRLPNLAESAGEVTVQGRLIAQISRAYELQGAIQSAAAGNAAAPKESRPSRIWQNIPNVNFSAQVLVPLAVLQTAPELEKDVLLPQPREIALLREWPAADSGVAKHYGYAFQWFALCALIVVLYVWFQLIAPRRHKRSV